MPSVLRSENLNLYIPWRSRSLPFDWNEEFAREAPLRLEIGFGNGEFLAKCATADPHSDFVGIEMTWGSIKRASGFARRAGASNVRLLWEDARASVAWNFQEKSLTSITALYPCPWPKKRHAKFRLFQPNFMKLCNSRLKEACQMVIVTDSSDYRDEILQNNTRELTGFTSTLETIPASFDTKYEKKWQDTGQTEFYRLTFTKVDHHSIANPETFPMKHHVVPYLDPETFAPQDEKTSFTVQFKQFIFDPKQNIGLQEVYTHENSIEQHFYVRIKKQEKGWKIHPAGGPPLLPIKSAQRALDICKETAEAQASNK